MPEAPQPCKGCGGAVSSRSSSRRPKHQPIYCTTCNPDPEPVYTPSGSLLHVSSQDIVVTAGITYRQLDHWTRKGWLTPANTATLKEGVYRSYPMREAVVAVGMKVLIDLGFAVDKAAELANRVVAPTKPAEDPE